MKISKRDRATLDRAATICERLAIYEARDTMGNPEAVRRILRYKFAGKTREEFHVLYLNSQHELLATECMFVGTIDGASVYPREIVKAALAHNAAALLLAHNHPSGAAEPSVGDRRITERLQAALALVDIRVIDHVIMGSDTRESFSFAEDGVL